MSVSRIFINAIAKVFLGIFLIYITIGLILSFSISDVGVEIIWTDTGDFLRVMFLWPLFWVFFIGSMH